jgi:hypothetical protein
VVVVVELELPPHTMAQMMIPATAAPPMIQSGSIPTAATGAGATGPASSGAGGGAAASGAGATDVAPPEVAPPDDAAPPLSPCANALPVAVKSSAPPANIETHFRCMAFLPLQDRRNGSL